MKTKKNKFDPGDWVMIWQGYPTAKGRFMYCHEIGHKGKIISIRKNTGYQKEFGEYVYSVFGSGYEYDEDALVLLPELPLFEKGQQLMLLTSPGQKVIVSFESYPNDYGYITVEEQRGVSFNVEISNVVALDKVPDCPLCGDKSTPTKQGWGCSCNPQTTKE